MNSFDGSSEKNLAAHALGGFFCNWIISENIQLGRGVEDIFF